MVLSHLAHIDIGLRLRLRSAIQQVHRFPIPLYDLEDEVCRKLSELGRLAAEKAWQLLPKLLARFGYDKKLRERGYLTPNEIGKLRNAIREHLKDILKQIDELVWKLLTNDKVRTYLKTNLTPNELDKEIEKVKEESNRRVAEYMKDRKGKSILDYLYK